MENIPAFPSDGNSMDQRSRVMGMTLRDYFAGQAIVGLSAAPSTDGRSYKSMAEDAYKQADAMLAERAKV